MAKSLTNSTTGDPSPVTEPSESMRGPVSPGETALYIAQFTAELSYLARRADLDLLAYLLDMARLEASRTGGSQGI